MNHSDKRESICIGLMGFGIVGGGVARFLLEKKDAIARQVGCPLVVRKILVRNPDKKRSIAVGTHLLTTEVADILTDPEIDIVVEVIGGENPALEYVREALLRGKYVVTANKEVIAKHGSELVSVAQERGVGLLYEASVGAGIPLIAPFEQNLCANRIQAIYAIINGTTNYILTKMSREGMEFLTSLRKAQELGYAEADPYNDIEGIDAVYKLAILASLAFHTPVHPQDIYYEGITRLTERDFRYARELGYAIKLLAIAKEKDNEIEVRVHPTLIPESFLLAKVEDVYNGVQVEGDLVGKVLFYGEGAGALPTSSAIIADIIAAARSITLGGTARSGLIFDEVKTIKPISQVETRYYLRMSVADRPRVLAQISGVLGDRLISIASVIQKEADASTQSAEIVIMTHPAQELAMQEALKEMERLPVVREISNFIRVEG